MSDRIVDVGYCLYLDEAREKLQTLLNGNVSTSRIHLTIYLPQHQMYEWFNQRDEIVAYIQEISDGILRVNINDMEYLFPFYEAKGLTSSIPVNIPVKCTRTCDLID